MSGNRYDRQIRLWGEDGQNSIQKASVCVLGSSALAAEILKSLVLPGIGRFCIVDDAVVGTTDLGQNFFVTSEDVGKSRAAVISNYLSELNPTVKGEFRNCDVRDLTDELMAQLQDFSIVIATNLDEITARKVGDYLYENGVFFIYTRVCGMIGYVRLCVRQHVIWNVHEEHSHHDFRIATPFEELMEMADSEELATMDHERHSHTPYLLLYLEALKKWRLTHKSAIADNENGLCPDANNAGLCPENYQERKDFQKVLFSLRKPDEKGSLDEENFEEAKRNLLKSFPTYKISSRVGDVLDDVKAASIDDLSRQFEVNGDTDGQLIRGELLRPFWIFAAAVREFSALHDGYLPLSGQLPDMTSDSKRYVQLQQIYRNKAAEHAKEVFEIAKRIFKDRRKLFADYGEDCAHFSPVKHLPNAGDLCAQDQSLTTDDSLTRMSESSTTGMEAVPPLSASNFAHVPDLCQSEAALTTAADCMDVDKAVAGADGTTMKNDGDLSWMQCREFCKNAAKIAVQRGTSLSEECEDGIEKILLQIHSSSTEDVDEPSKALKVDPLVWFLLLKAMDRFYHEKGRYPGTNGVPCTIDAKDLERRLLGLVEETKNETLLQDVNRLLPQAAIEEVCRYGVAEPHVVAAVVGGVVAQEAIKLVTHQYLPLDNALVYDGHSQSASSFRV